VTAAPPPPKTTSKQVGVDFQAENALIRDGAVKSSPAGFTGTGFVDTDNKVGSSVQWTVNASRTGQADVIFRFANGNDGFRPMDVTVNGILVFSLDFPSTGGFDTYRTVTVRVSLIGGANRIKATSSTANGGPNLDKITVA
jgi:exo-1,4-beta-D-glucosaminidase